MVGTKVMKSAQRGFTLLELLIVIAILAILATIAVVILNPAELTAQGRDSQRLTDLDSINTSLALLSKDKCNATDWDTGGTPDLVEANTYGTAGTTTATFIVNTSRAVDGTGWIPLPISGVVGGSPLATLPVDPTNTAGAMHNAATGGLHYDFKATKSDNATPCRWELATNMESALYKNGGAQNKETNDGGSTSTNEQYFYQKGTDLTLMGATAP